MAIFGLITAYARRARGLGGGGSRRATRHDGRLALLELLFELLDSLLALVAAVEAHAVGGGAEGLRVTNVTGAACAVRRVVRPALANPVIKVSRRTAFEPESLKELTRRGARER